MSDAESSIAQDRNRRNGIINPATPMPYSPPYAAQAPPGPSGSPGPPTQGNKPQDDDLISLDVPDPSKREQGAGEIGRAHV